MLSLIGKLIKQLRQENSQSLEDLAQRAGVTQSKLEAIEEGRVTPSLGVLMKISRALGSRLGTLLDGQENFGAVVTRARKGVEVDVAMSADEHNAHLKFFALAQGKTDRHMEPLTIEVKDSDKAVQLKSEHEGEEFLYVLEGSVKLYYGEETHLLEKGDSIYYDSVVPHYLTNAATQKSRVMAVIYMPY